MWRHIDVQADWGRSWTYSRAPNAIDLGFFNMPVQAPTWGQPFYGYSEKPPHFSHLLPRALGHGRPILVFNPQGTGKVHKKEGSKNTGFPRFIHWSWRQKVYCLIDLELTLNRRVFFLYFSWFGYKIRRTANSFRYFLCPPELAKICPTCIHGNRRKHKIKIGICINSK